MKRTAEIFFECTAQEYLCFGWPRIETFLEVRDLFFAIIFSFEKLERFLRLGPFEFCSACDESKFCRDHESAFFCVDSKTAVVIAHWTLSIGAPSCDQFTAKTLIK
jgi:hypothetical protein